MNTSRILLAGVVVASVNAYADFGSFVKGAASAAVSTAVAPSAPQVAKAPATKVKMAEFYVKGAEKGSRRLGNQAAVDARQRVDELKQSYADDPAVIALDQRLAKVEGEIQAAKSEQSSSVSAVQATAAALGAPTPDVPKQIAAATGGTAALPWVMAKDYRDNEAAIQDYIKKLGVQKNEDVVALDAQLRARAEMDRAIVKAGGDGMSKAQEELDRYERFIFELYNALMRGYFEGSVEKNGDVGFKSYQMRTKDSSVRVMWDPQAQKYCFYEWNSTDKVFLDDEDVNNVKFKGNQLYYASVFADKIDDNDARQLRYGGRVCANRLMAALQNNTKDNIKRQPLPRKGKLHGEFAAEALVIARGTLSHPDAQEVFIDADDWTIDYNLGSPVRRRFGYWVLKNTPAGRKVFRMQACQDYQGGGKYGKLKYYAVGGGQYFVE